MKLKFLILHCTATAEGDEVTSDKIMQWHKGPRNNANGTVTYLGELYPSREALPDDYIGNVAIKKLVGRGWRQLGYTDIFHLNGGVERLVTNNEDNNVDPWEITNGATGINSISRHVVYAGGCEEDGKTPKDTRTPEQRKAMLRYCQDMIRMNPDILIGGHNQFAAKACPSFNVPMWLQSVGIPEKNIYRK